MNNMMRIFTMSIGLIIASTCLSACDADDVYTQLHRE